MNLDAPVEVDVGNATKVVSTTLVVTEVLDSQILRKKKLEALKGTWEEMLALVEGHGILAEKTLTPL